MFRKMRCHPERGPAGAESRDPLKPEQDANLRLYGVLRGSFDSLEPFGFSFAQDDITIDNHSPNLTSIAPTFHPFTASIAPDTSSTVGKRALSSRLSPGRIET